MEHPIFNSAEKCAQRHTHCRHTQWLRTVCLRGSAWPPRHNNNVEILIGTKCAKNALILLIVAVKVMCLIVWRPLFYFLDCLTSFWSWSQTHSWVQPLTHKTQHTHTIDLLDYIIRIGNRSIFPFHSTSYSVHVIWHSCSYLGKQYSDLCIVLCS